MTGISDFAAVVPQNGARVAVEPPGMEAGARRGSRRTFFRTARRKLLALDFAVVLNDLMSPPGNRLEALAGNRDGQHSIRINDQWRVFFRWTETGAQSVEIVDCHRWRPTQ